MRLSIDISTEQHQRLKATAALHGQTLKDYVLERVLVSTEEDEALQQLETFLAQRIQEAEGGGMVQKSVLQIFEETLQGKQ